MGGEASVECEAGEGRPGKIDARDWRVAPADSRQGMRGGDAGELEAGRRYLWMVVHADNHQWPVDDGVCV